MKEIAMRRHPTLFAGAVIVSLSALSGSAAAVTAAQQNALRAHCRDDFMALCAGVTPGGKDALVCLQKHAASLSPACQKAVGATMPAPAPKAAKAATPAVAVQPAPAAAPAPAAPESGFVRGGILINKACARYMLMHCHGMGLDMGRKVACLVDYVNAGNFVGPRCRAVLRMTGHLR